MGKDKPKERSLKYFFRNFRTKHKMSIRGRNDEEDLWYIYVSPLRIFLAVIGFLLVMFAIVILIVIYTPILDTLPGYPGKKSRAVLVDNVLRIDSLENELNIMRMYTDNVNLIMDGKIPVVMTGNNGQDSVSGEKSIVSPSEADSLLREQLEGDGRYGLVLIPETVDNNLALKFEFVTPVRGEVISPFDPKSGNFGIGINPTESQQVVSVQDGTVIMSLWTPNDGYIIEIQHKDGFISVYKHNTQLLKTVGQKAEAGEAIAYIDTGTDSDDFDNELILELWHDGRPLDPQQYVFF